MFTAQTTPVVVDGPRETDIVVTRLPQAAESESELPAPEATHTDEDVPPNQEALSVGTAFQDNHSDCNSCSSQAAAEDRACKAILMAVDGDLDTILTALGLRQEDMTPANILKSKRSCTKPRKDKRRLLSAWEQDKALPLMQVALQWFAQTVT